MIRSPYDPVSMRDTFSLRAMPCQNLAREISDFLRVRLMKVTILRMLQQRYAMRFLLKEGLAGKEIRGV
jgi:hypothetical protein